MKKEVTTMAQLVEELGSSLIPYRRGDVVEVEILDVARNKILVDVAGLALGVILEREFSPTMADLKKGDKVLAYVLSMENEQGYVVLSLRRADRERIFRTLEQKFKDGEILTVKVKKVSRGGLLAEYGSLEGFLPISQLAFGHYPVGAKTEKDILDKLSKLISQNLQVKILAFDKSTNKLIFSEKQAALQQRADIIKNLKIGQKLSGTISGIVDFGLFINLGKADGLVHISEVSWDKISNLKQLYKIGQEVSVVVIDIEKGKVYLSMKRLLPDPWVKKVAKLKEGEKLPGEVIKLAPFGAFVKIKPGLDALCPLEGLGKGVADPSEVLKLGEKYDFKIESIDIKRHKINLSLLKEEKKTKTKRAKKLPDRRVKKPGGKK